MTPIHMHSPGCLVSEPGSGSCCNFGLTVNGNLARGLRTPGARPRDFQTSSHVPRHGQLACRHLAELLAGVEAVGSRITSVMPSETIGPMQAGILPTLLPLIGLKFFDPHGRVLSRLPIKIPMSDEDIANGAAAVTLGLEGSWPDDEIERVMAGLAIDQARSTKPGANPSRVQRVAKRVSSALIGAGRGRLNLEIDVPDLARFDIHSHVLAGRVTSVAMVLYPDGRAEVSQALLLPPDTKAEHGEYNTVPPQRVARLLVLAQRVMGQTASLKDHRIEAEIEELEMGKWVDPLLGVVGWFARRARLQSLAANEQFRAESDKWQTVVARNLDVFRRAAGRQSRVCASYPAGLRGVGCDPRGR
jgi:hypothetical protein